MATATMTSKGQLTLPKDVRDRAGIAAGDRLSVSLNAEGVIELRPERITAADVARLIPKPPRRTPRMSQTEMDDAIAEGILARYRRSET